MMQIHVTSPILRAAVAAAMIAIAAVGSPIVVPSVALAAPEAAKPQNR